MDETRGPEQDDPQPSGTALEATPGMYPAVYEPAPGGSYPGAYEPALQPEPTPEPTDRAEPTEPTPEPTDRAEPTDQPEPAPPPKPEPAPLLQPTSPPSVAAGMPRSTPAPAHRCPWCSAATPPGASHCPSCHASLAERESLGDILVPGVTGIDPSLVHKNDIINKVMSIPGAKLGTLGIGLSIAATIAQGVDHRSQEKMMLPSRGIGVPPMDALVLAERLDRATESTETGAAQPAESTTPTAESTTPTATDPGPEPIPAEEMAPWTDTPWAAEIAPLFEELEGTGEQAMAPPPNETSA
jgi:hypothetical protein